MGTPGDMNSTWTQRRGVVDPRYLERNISSGYEMTPRLVDELHWCKVDGNEKSQKIILPYVSKTFFLP